MEQKKMKIYPYLIDSKRMAGYYELLLDDNYELKLFSKKKDKDVYEYFLPSIRDYLFWSFDMNLSSEIKEYEKLKNDIKAAICATYTCNVFEKGKTTVVCFGTGICFAITEDKKKVNELTKYELTEEMELINLRSSEEYLVKDGKMEHTYAQILQLYKLIYLNKVNKDLQNPSLFDKARNGFVDFTQRVYGVTETDKDKYCDELKEKLNLDKKYVVVENQFDLLYKNSKLNENLAYKRFTLVFLLVIIIIGIIILGNSII